MRKIVQLCETSLFSGWGDGNGRGFPNDRRYMHDVMTNNYVTMPRRLALVPMFRVILTRESLLWSPIAIVYQYLALLCINKIKMSFILGKGYSQKFGIINTVAWLLHMKLISRFICNWLTRLSAFIMIIYEQKIWKYFLFEGLSSFRFLLQSMWEESALKETRNQQQNQHAAVSLGLTSVKLNKFKTQ